MINSTALHHSRSPTVGLKRALTAVGLLLVATCTHGDDADNPSDPLAFARKSGLEAALSSANPGAQLKKLSPKVLAEAKKRGFGLAGRDKKGGLVAASSLGAKTGGGGSQVVAAAASSSSRTSAAEAQLAADRANALAQGNLELRRRKELAEEHARVEPWELRGVRMLVHVPPNAASQVLHAAARRPKMAQAMRNTTGSVLALPLKLPDGRTVLISVPEHFRAGDDVRVCFQGQGDADLTEVRELTASLGPRCLRGPRTRTNAESTLSAPRQPRLPCRA